MAYRNSNPVPFDYGSPDYANSLNFGGAPYQSPAAYSPVGGDYHGSYTPSDVLKGQESGLGIMDSFNWGGEQTGVMGALDQYKGGFMSGGTGPGAGGGGMFGNFLGKTENGVTTPGWGGAAIGAVSALSNAYLGMKQYGLAKKTLAHNKDVFAKNFDAQKRTTNASLRDRQTARVASQGGGVYQSVSSYMDENGIR